MDHRKTWTSLEKRKQRRTNENTSMSEEAKVNLANDDLHVAIISSGQKIELREKKGSIKLWELESNNRDIDRDSSDESGINESSDSLRQLLHQTFFHFVFFALPLSLVYGVGISFHLTHFARSTSYKKNRATESLHLDGIAKHKGFLEIRAQNFTRSFKCLI